MVEALGPRKGILIGGQRRQRRRAGLVVAAYIWTRPWSPLSFTLAESRASVPRRHPTVAAVRGRHPSDTICGRPPAQGGWAGAGLVALGVFGLFEGDGHDDKHRSRKRKETEEDKPDDSLKRSVSEWWDGLFGQSKESRRSKQKPEEADGDCSSGVVNVLASVKTSVTAAVLGTGGQEPETKASEAEEEDWWQNAQAVLGMAEKEHGDEGPELPSVSREAEAPRSEEMEVEVAAEPAVPEEQEEEAAQEPKEEVPPEVPGMEDANLIVKVDIEPKRRKVKLGEKGVRNLMARSDREVLEAMAQEGWEVEVVDEAEGLYTLSLPPVLYEVMGTSISIPAPKFLTRLRSSDGQSLAFQERMWGDLILQNGENIFTLQLGFPFRSKLSISAAGWTRARVGFDGDEIVSSNYVEVGIQLPKVPGLTNIMEYFVKSYGTQSTQECTDALARAAETMPESPLQSIEDTVKDLFKPLTDQGQDMLAMGSGPGRPKPESE
ncbi:unnamed protein product [Effrenium voratum]|uniref:Uncharacterized protein n=1 Tax=Effrenium voratum TaxID=2562239 RepID=A0AA36HZM3_9DINO|nr:unnamed protein product [Effrenium voratum]